MMKNLFIVCKHRMGIRILFQAVAARIGNKFAQTQFFVLYCTRCTLGPYCRRCGDKQADVRCLKVDKAVQEFIYCRHVYVMSHFLQDNANISMKRSLYDMLEKPLTFFVKLRCTLSKAVMLEEAERLSPTRTQN